MTVYQAVLFDCDGVLVDSEPITARVLHQCLQESGWALDYAECCRIFIGKAVRDERARIERETGQPLTDDWMAAFYARRNVALLAELEPIAGALQAVADVHAQFQGRIACASGADRTKLRLQLDKVGMSHYFDQRLFSGQELPRNKPHPDVYLQAAAALDAEIGRCVVVEDSLTGARAGLAAGATVIGFAPDEPRAQALRTIGVHAIVPHMAALLSIIERLPQANSFSISFETFCP